MDKRELIKIIKELDNDLESSIDIILIGGAAMILHYGAVRTTNDVDVLILRGGVEELKGAYSNAIYCRLMCHINK